MHEYFIFPQIDPVIVHIYGPLAIRWYGLMYLIGFAAAFVLAKTRLHRTHLSKDQLSDMMFYSFMGVVVGGRVGNVLFYDFAHFMADPVYLFRVDQGGMSFHGGMLGVILALWIFARKAKMPLLALGDFIAPLVPIGLGAGRIGNFINGELWGRVTDVPWAMIFPHVDNLPRHPSQLYQAFTEGLVLFTLLWWYSSKPRPRGAVSGLFLLAYGILRFLVEYVREPEEQVRSLYGEWITQGQALCIPMIILGSYLMLRAYKKHNEASA
ncbi:prolipoprotein diacylglyceryl transferase [Bowmanella sp. JS7-9]|uniref:Phosphatidylglycerol--prolipoprotein diacylglyceryl transferase n=1 Tax=Pseudobowmanella zhangzhouensis TaxID=1537679 RepID=A0ABW1XLE2_9ALTE|nr:prolipoprotein diacylglyceryl transferase [Bowmanella sp. JS7-9]TBX22075.1 prolipoprotein diacylglyceryl transferase [Bowmanella sp. JS7-9]